MTRNAVAALGLAASLLAGAAHAGCAPPGPAARRIAGVVREAAGGGAICVQTGPDPLRLVRVRLSDVSAPLTSPGGEGAKWALRRLARGRQVVCAMDRPDSGRCTLGGQPIGALLARKGR
jgi:hypothetical protein